MQIITHIVRRELLLAARKETDSLTTLGFFILAVTLFPFGVGPGPQMLERISSGVLWVIALLTVLLSLDSLFRSDYEDGSLDLLVLAADSAIEITLGKVIAHWITTGLPLVSVTPLLAILLQMDTDSIYTLVIAMVLGTPTLSLIGSVGAALVLGARRGGALLSLLVLPLYVPVLVFGVSAVDAESMGFTELTPILILAALLCIALPLCLLAAAIALKQAVA